MFPDDKEGIDAVQLMCEKRMQEKTVNTATMEEWEGKKKKRKLKGSVTCIVGNMRDVVILVFCASLAVLVSEAEFQSGYLTSVGDIFAGMYAELESTAWNIVQKHGL